MGKIIKLQRVRLSFPALFKARAFEEGQEPKFGATFLLDKKLHAAAIQEISAGILEVAIEEFGSKEKIPKGIKLCLRDGAEKEDTEGYGPGIKFIAARSKKRVPVVGLKRQPLSEEDGTIYAGCYVNAVIRLWVQDNKFGKRVNAQLQAVQFCGQGDAFGDSAVNVNEVFDEVEEASGTDGLGDLGGGADADPLSVLG